MAALVGLVSSIVGLIHITGIVAGSCCTYISTQCDANKEIKKLRDELTDLSVVITQLHSLATGSNPPTRKLLDLDGSLQACTAEMTDLQNQLQKVKQGFRWTLYRVTWPLKEQQTTKVLFTLERFKSLFNLALTAEHLFLSKAIEAFMKNTDSKVDDILQCVQVEFAALKLQKEKEDQSRAAEQRKIVLEWVFQGSTRERHTDISSKRQQGTGLWLSRNSTYEAWIKSDPDFRLLWGYGIPGAGKTYLSSRVIDDLEVLASQRGFGIAHIYFNYKEQGTQIAIAVVSSLIKQLLCGQDCDLPASLLDLYHDLSRKCQRPESQHLQQLQKILFLAMGGHSRSFFVFDALDEADERHRNAILPLFHALGQHGASVFMTSRPYPRDILESISTDYRKIKIEAKEEDLVLYVESTIDQDPHARAVIHRDLRDQIVAKLVQCCKGMFLLVHFYIEDLRKYTTSRKIETALKKIDSSLKKEECLYGIYKTVLLRITQDHQSRKDLAINVLSWLLKARRMLTMEEARIAVAIDSDISDGELDMADVGTILDVCGGLVTVDEKGRTLQFAHYSVHEYLTDHALFEKADLLLTKACLCYLSNEQLAKASISLKNLATETGDRILEIFAHSESALPLKRLSVESPSPLSLWIKENNQKMGRGLNAPPVELQPSLWIYAAKNLYFHLRRCDEGESAQFFYKFLASPMLPLYAAMRKFAIKKDGGLWGPDDVNISIHDIPGGDRMLCEAAFSGHCIVVRQLLSTGMDVHEEDKYHKPPIRYAAASGNEAVVRALLEFGAHASPKRARDYYEAMPLDIAVAYRYYGIVKVLVEHGNIDIYGLTSQCVPVLARTVVYGRAEDVREVIRLGAGIDVTCDIAGLNRGIHRAENVGSVLARHLKSALRVRSNRYATKFTPLRLASVRRDTDIFMQLLQAKFRASSSHEAALALRTALDRKSSEEVVHALNRYGADISTQNKELMEALKQFHSSKILDFA